MAKKKPLLKAEAKKESVYPDIITRWLGLAGIFIAVSLFLFTQDSAQIKITLFYIAAIVALCVWAGSLIKERVNIFTARNFALLFPFLLYFGYVFISFFFHPYMTARTPALLRFAACGFLFLTAAFNFNFKRAEDFFGYVLIAAWCVSVYGAVQILNIYLLPGIDVLKWTEFFGNRIFSTIANPNFLADFCLFCFFIALGRFLYEPKKSLAVLMGLLAANIMFTLSKGAWLAFAAGVFLFGAIYFNFFSEKYKSHRLKYNLLISAVLLAAVLAAGIFTAKRMQSVNFRLSTWRSALEMTEEKPVFGMGKGSFQFIYTAYKRPEIFYMEGIHNGETQHAENYPLEQSTELGLVGLGLFLLVLLWQIDGSWRKLKELANSPKTRREGLILLSCFGAAGVIYIHNMVDVSIYFVSTAYFLALFGGILFALNFGPLEAKRVLSEDTASGGGKFFKLCYIVLSLLVLFILYLLFCDFYEVSAPALQGKFRYFVIYWICFIAGSFYTAWLFLKTAFESKRVGVLAIYAAALGLIYVSFFPFRADFYTAAGAGLAARKDISAPMYYNKAIKLNPFAVGLNQFSGIVFQNLGGREKKNLAYAGDPEDGLYNDYERALRAYKRSLSLIPNDTMIHYNLGALYHDMAKYEVQKGNKEKAEHYYKLSEESLKRSLLLDPTYDNAYYQLANIALEHNDYRRAANWVSLYIEGPEEVSNPLYIAKHRNDAVAQKHLRGIRAAGGI